jgi:hypothetical protein
MSVADLWHDMYTNVVAELRDSREETHQAKMQVIRLEGQRLSMLCHLELACGCMQKTYPVLTAQLREHIKPWKAQYETAKPQSEVAPDPTPVDGPAHSDRTAPVHTDVGTTTRAPF